VERPGGWIGRYKLVSLLGEGGMGVVYLARQEQPIRREVALKVIKPGMDSARVIARFEAERQALARMEHPHIARIYDAGLTLTGRPYFVMELVRGVPITEYCDRQGLTIEERLRLFLHVCEAVQHAHQRGIIHRDLKPSNILVVSEGDEAVAKVIDFGVARAIDEPLAERTLCTEQGQLLGTPEYMSPEQLDAGRQDLDTRTDIYSLGLILYQLLAGVLPFDLQMFRTAGFAHLRRIICEQDPPTPSRRVRARHRSTRQVAQPSPAVELPGSPPRAGRLHGLAQRRRTDARTLRRRLHGDLDWIVMKALEKDRTRRYETAESMARDIEHHLNHEPVVAGPPGRLYRFRKLVRRNRGLFAGVTLVAASLMLGLTVAIVALLGEQRARWDAVAAQEKEAASRREVQAQAYVSDMSLAQQALALNDLGRARRLLEAHRPAPGELDLRGWEWRYLWQECRSDARATLCRCPYALHSVAYSLNGKTLAIAGEPTGGAQPVELWDVPTGRRVATLPQKGAQCLAFSPCDDLLAADDGRNQINLWRTATPDLVHRLPVAGAVVALRFSPDGRRLASLNHPGEATVWDVAQWTVVCHISGLGLIGTMMGALDFSPDNKILVIGDANHHLRTVDLASGHTHFDIPEAHPEPLTSVAWAPNNSVIASGSGFFGGPIHLWEAVSGKPLGRLEGHTSYIKDLIFSADSRWLYSACSDQTIRIWDVAQQRGLSILRGSADEINGLTLAPDGETLASVCKDGVAAFWNARPRLGQEQPRQIGLGRFVQPAFAPDSRVLALPRAGTVRLLDLATGEEIEPLPALGTDVSMVVYSPDGTLLISGSPTGEIRVWSGTEHRLVHEWRPSDAPIYLLHFRTDGRRLLSVDEQGKAIWWDTLTWQAGRTFTVGGDPLAAAPGLLGRTVSPDGRLLAIGTWTGAVRWLDAETGELLDTTSGGHAVGVTGISFSRDNKLAASVSGDGTVAFWDPSSLRLITAFKGHMLGAHAAAFSPDGRRLVTGGSSGREVAKLWDVTTRRELMTLAGHGSEFMYAAFSPDGHWLAACGLEGEFHLWQAPSREKIAAAEHKP
jgi:WD40 repeat protein/serine/threonine protein kinase